MPGEAKIKRDNYYRIFDVKTVVCPSGNINNNNYDNNNGVRPFCVKQTDRVGTKPKSEKATKNQISFHLVVNTKVFLWIKKLYAVLKICIKLTRRLKPVKDIIAAVLNFRA